MLTQRSLKIDALFDLAWLQNTNYIIVLYIARDCMSVYFLLTDKYCNNFFTVEGMFCNPDFTISEKFGKMGKKRNPINT